MNRLLRLALAGPPIVVIALFAASGAAALVSDQPLIWKAQPMTLTEAIGMHDSSEIVRQIVLGANPNAHYDTWDVLKRFQSVSVTPLEAAVATRELYLFDLVIAHGGLVTADNAPALHCFAAQEHATEIAAYIDRRFPPSASCEGVKLPW
jgi:hypothetical protein